MLLTLTGSRSDWCDLQTLEKTNRLSAREEAGEPKDEPRG